MNHMTHHTPTITSIKQELVKLVHSRSSSSSFFLLSILDNENRALYLKQALCLKFIVARIVKIFVGENNHFLPIFNPVLNYSRK